MVDTRYDRARTGLLLVGPCHSREDATAAFSREAMHAAHQINGPTFAHAILTTSELVAALSKV